MAICIRFPFIYHSQLISYKLLTSTAFSCAYMHAQTNDLNLTSDKFTKSILVLERIKDNETNR